jgi:hypothetical protein
MSDAEAETRISLDDALALLEKFTAFNCSEKCEKRLNQTSKYDYLRYNAISSYFIFRKQPLSLMKASKRLLLNSFQLTRPVLIGERYDAGPVSFLSIKNCQRIDKVASSKPSHL